MNKYLLNLILSIGLLLPVNAMADDDEDSSIIYNILTYVPSRVLDALDIVRLRARVGPGFAVGVRVTEALDVFAGAYTSLYVGLPGPRGRTLPKSPIGVENNAGIEVSVADASTGFLLDPGYSSTEIGFGAQVAIIGFDVGIDPVEIIDFATGLLFIDIRDDDL